MSYAAHIRTYRRGPWAVILEQLYLSEGSDRFSELYTSSDKHIGGTTVQLPKHLQDHNNYKFFIGQTTPAELARWKARNGCANPSKEAYADLQKELEHYATAQECVIQCRVEWGGHQFGESQSCVVDVSDVYPETPQQVCKHIVSDNGLDFIREAIDIARLRVNSRNNVIRDDMHQVAYVLELLEEHGIDTTNLTIDKAINKYFELEYEDL